MDILQKMGVSKLLLGSTAGAASLLGAFMNDDMFEDMTLQRDGDLYQRGVLTASEIYLRVSLNSTYVQFFRIPVNIQNAQKESIAAHRELLDQTVEHLNGLYHDF